jgi:predicted RNA-binding protein with PUA-like domain
MQHWLMKSEPSTFGIDDLVRAPRHRTSWDGIRNYTARNFLRDSMKRGDQVFLYHSSCDVPGIAGIMEVVKEGYPEAEEPWFKIDVKFLRRFEHVITLATLRRHESKELRGMLLLRKGNRLSITPVETAHWKFILSLA